MRPAVLPAADAPARPVVKAVVRHGAEARAGKGNGPRRSPKRPIQVRTTGRIYAVDDDDQGEDVEIDNFATSLPEDASDAVDANDTNDEPDQDEKD